MFVRAAKSLRKGDELTDGYVSVFCPSYERREKIQARYGFRIDDERSSLEDELLTKKQVQPFLDRIDKASAYEELKSIAADTDKFVNSQMTKLGSGNFSIDVQHVAARLGPFIGE